MAYSMTGYGKGEASSGSCKFVVEIRTVNHRYCEVGIKMPRHLLGLEDQLRRLVHGRIARGKADVFVSYEELSGSRGGISVNMGLAEAYCSAAETLRAHFGLSDGISLAALLQNPDIFRAEGARFDADTAWPILQAAAEPALDALGQMRASEGGRLSDDIAGKIRNVRSSLAAIEARAPYVVEEYRLRLESRLKELLPQGAYGILGARGESGAQGAYGARSVQGVQTAHEAQSAQGKPDPQSARGDLGKPSGQSNQGAQGEPGTQGARGSQAAYDAFGERQPAPAAPDESRIAMEVAIFADRCSIDEEIVRLKSHLSQAAEYCASDMPIGRKLDFVIQEINREINTIGSKSNDLAINGAVVELKAEVEKIREQAQNLE
jgi:uncharacterized protein YicC (UPF0701 family)